MAKFFNDNSNLDNNGNSFIPNDEPGRVEDDTPSFVSASSAEQMMEVAEEPNTLEDVSEEILDATGYKVEALTCFDFSEHLKYIIGNLILIGLILI